jgi:formate dehydrogenase subunit gamma
MTQRPERVVRFDRIERAVHWTTAALFGVALATAGVLYIPSMAAAAGRRALVRDIHVAAGFLLPVPLLVALAGRWGRMLRSDVAELGRWVAADRRWLRSRVPEAVSGKFNAGQKLNAALVLGALLVMVGTGSIMHWPAPFPLNWRTGATFVHDWFATGLAVVIAGHVTMAGLHPGSLRGMITGQVGRGWAERYYPRWTAALGTPGLVTDSGISRAVRPLLGVAAGCAVVVAAGVLVPLLAAGERGDAPAAVARRFQAALEGNDLQQAYELLSPAARSGGLSPEAFFRSRVHQQDDRYLDPGQSESYVKAITVHRQYRAGGSFHVALRVTMSDGRTTWRQVDLSRTNGRWLVDRFALLGTDPCDEAPSVRRRGCRHP